MNEKISTVPYGDFGLVYIWTDEDGIEHEDPYLKGVNVHFVDSDEPESKGEV